MNKLLIFYVIIIILISCKDKLESPISKSLKFTEVIKDDYELYKPTNEIKAVLILFGGYPESIEDIKNEFKILDLCLEKDIAVIISNYNQKLWLKESEKHELAKNLQEIFVEHEIPTQKIFIGGFSSGGVVSLLMSDFIIGLKQYYIDPKGVFIIDSPIDLVALYESSKKNVERNFSQPSIQESTWLIESLNRNFGIPENNIESYEDHAVYTFKTDNISNLNHLKSTKIRLYTEPDTLWWKEHRLADYQQMNAFYIKKLSESLDKNGFKHVEYIPTVNKGYRANGDRHPHSWSIVDKNNLINWMTN